MAPEDTDALDEPGADDDEHSALAVLAERARRYRKLPSETGIGAGADLKIAMVLFERAGARYGAPLDALDGLQRSEAITPLPGVSPVIKGLEKIRGRIVTVHDLGSFGKAAHPVGEKAWLLIGRDQRSSVALLADDIEGIEMIYRSGLRPAPIALGDRRDCFMGFGEDGVAYLDFDKLIAHEPFFRA